jgi:hypothetical protein
MLSWTTKTEEGITSQVAATKTASFEVYFAQYACCWILTVSRYGYGSENTEHRSEASAKAAAEEVK